MCPKRQSHSMAIPRQFQGQMSRAHVEAWQGSHGTMQPGFFEFSKCSILVFCVPRCGGEGIEGGMASSVHKAHSVYK